jgi:hypothetical protein
MGIGVAPPVLKQAPVGTGTWDSPLMAAQRAHLLAVRCLGNSAVGRPSGQNSQPWSVTTFTELQPAANSAWMRRASRSISGPMTLGS